jgi:hypothetical protein
MNEIGEMLVLYNCKNKNRFNYLKELYQSFNQLSIDLLGSIRILLLSNLLILGHAKNISMRV